MFVWPDFVGFANGDDLPEVMLAVDELKSAPLVDAERAKDDVAGTSLRGAEDFLGFVAEGVDAIEVFGDGVGEVFAGEWKRCRSGRDGRRGFAAGWKVAEMDERVLPEALQDGGFGAGGCALGDAGVEGHLGAAVTEEQVLDDLLDTPLVRVRRRVKLGLGGVESAETVGNLTLELVEGGVHSGRITLHRWWAGRLWMGGAGLPADRSLQMDRLVQVS